MNLQSASKQHPLSNPIVIYLLLALATLFVYSPVRNYGFLDFDDNEYFFNNPHTLGGLTLANIQWAFTTDDTGNWHPLTWLSLMLDVQLFGQGAVAPHLVNALLHIANVILVFCLFRQMTGALGRSAILALLFAVHPLHVESVAWVAERKDVLSSFFGLLALLFYAHYVADKKRRSLMVLALLFFTCALMSKSMVVTLPFVMLLLDFWPLQRFSVSSLRPLLLEKVPFFLLIFVDSILTFLAQQKGNAVTSLNRFPLDMRMENVFVSYIRYLGKIFWPVNLATPYSPLRYWPALVVFVSVVLFVALCVAAVKLRKQFPYAFTGWFWFAGMLVPVIGLVQVGAQSMADRYVYLPMIGVLLILVWGAAEFFDRNQVPRGAIIFGTIILCFALAVRARNQLGFWQNDETLFGHALAVTTNNNVASHNLGYWYEKNGQADKAMDYYFDADQLGSRDPNKLYNAANAFAKIGHWNEAIKVYRRALELSPNQPDVLNNLGFALTQNKQLSEATACFETVLALQPNSADAHNNLATILFMQGRLQDAAAQFSDALQLAPGNFQICANLAGTYEGLGQTNLAVQYYQQALRLQPDNQKLRAHLQSLGVPPAK
ncbi:MAG TPA: tetratricopeptide repeat protein [Pseudomonadales bacterium]|nr:tetratricopeptide repeat protein [Pseudomonadales bacterium]